MDNKMVQQWGADILCYRLRSARNRKRAKQKDAEKKLLKLHREEAALQYQRFNLGWEPLDPPVQKGWTRSFVLRSDVARSRQAEFYERILERINTTKWSHRKDFVVKKRALGRKKYVVSGQNLHRPDASSFSRMCFTEAEKRQFHEDWDYDPRRGRFVVRYVFSEPWRFVLKVQPNMIRRIRKRDPLLDSRLQILDSYLQRNNLRGTLTRLLHGNDRWKSSRYTEDEREENPIRNKPVYRILDEIRNEI